ncbi:hypothetical protein L2E82_12123 [Cichorium intybus]|uniref:Uncharacterized protein n=1 Tax=Cichorium intybus TaxID=13427 RepID=A0ACB9GFX0_CICIN|nr:hypothetical protein L2E82_12123 [Cichorium intybus]
MDELRSFDKAGGLFDFGHPLLNRIVGSFIMATGVSPSTLILCGFTGGMLHCSRNLAQELPCNISNKSLAGQIPSDSVLDQFGTYTNSSAKDIEMNVTDMKACEDDSFDAVIDKEGTPINNTTSLQEKKKLNNETLNLIRAEMSKMEVLRLISMWGRASAKPKPETASVKTERSIPIANDGQVLEYEMVENYSSDYENDRMKFKRGSNGEGSNRKKGLCLITLMKMMKKKMQDSLSKPNILDGFVDNFAPGDNQNQKRKILPFVNDEICSIMLDVSFQRMLKKEKSNHGNEHVALELWSDDVDGMGDFGQYRLTLLELVRLTASFKPLIAITKVLDRIIMIIKSLLLAPLLSQLFHSGAHIGKLKWIRNSMARVTTSSIVPPFKQPISVRSLQPKFYSLRLEFANLNVARGDRITCRYGGGANSRQQDSRRSPQLSSDDDQALDVSTIRSNTVRLIDDQQNMVGIVSKTAAIQMAEEAELDLVILSPDADPPVVKLMDYNKYKYEQQKKKREQQKKSAALRMDQKELKMGYNIDVHDYSVRLRAAQKFLKDGDKVKVIVNLKGRENEFRKNAIELLERFRNDIGELGIEESKNLKDRNMFMVLIPNKVVVQKEVPKKKGKSTGKEMPATV